MRRDVERRERTIVVMEKYELWGYDSGMYYEMDDNAEVVDTMMMTPRTTEIDPIEQE